MMKNSPGSAADGSQRSRSPATGNLLTSFHHSNRQDPEVQDARNRPGGIGTAGCGFTAHSLSGADPPKRQARRRSGPRPASSGKLLSMKRRGIATATAVLLIAATAWAQF